MSKIKTTEEEIIKEFGNILYSGASIEDSEGQIIRTTLSLDIALSGGIPEGTITNIAGKEKCGKTTLCLTLIAKAQKMGKECYYLDVESRLRTDLMKTIPGLVWTEEQEEATGLPKMKIIRSSIDKILSAEDYINIIDRLIKEKPGCLIILDSIAALASEDTIAAKAGESKRMASIPTLMYFLCRKAVPILSVTKATIVSITHLQANPGGYGGPNQVGGNAIQYFASNRLVCHGVEKVPATGPQVGHNAKFKCTAAALGSPGGEAIIYVRYGKGCDEEEDLVSIAEELGYLEKTGAWYRFIDETGEELKFQGKQKIVDFFKENPDKAQALENLIRDEQFKGKGKINATQN